MKFNRVVIAFATILPCLGQDTAQGDAQAPAPAAAIYAAMTPGERWNDFVSSNLASPVVALRALTAAGISHFNHEPVSYGMWSRGFFERAGSHYARFAVQGSIHSGLAAALGHDTRYYRDPGENAWRRTLHALRRTFITRDREGRNVFDISQMTALYASPMIAATWHPSRYAPLTQGFRAGNFGVGALATGNLFREFGPDLKHLIHK
jgi:hypothetical protein